MPVAPSRAGPVGFAGGHAGGHPHRTMSGPMGGPTGRPVSHSYGRVVPPKPIDEIMAGKVLDTEQPEESVDNRMKNMGIMFLIIAITILLICAAVVIRRKLTETPEKEKEAKPASKPSETK